MNHDAGIKKQDTILYGGFAFMLVIMITGNRDFFYDEHFYMDNVRLFNEHGLSAAYLGLHKASAGITQTLVQWACQPFTQLIPFRVRLVNTALLAAIIFLLSRIALHFRCAQNTGMRMLAIPMTYVCAGIALSEIPAIFFLLCALLAWLKYQEAQGSNIKGTMLFLLSAFCMSLAVLGRQPYLPLVFLFPLCSFPLNKRNTAQCILWIVLVLLPCIPVFYVWKGLVPQTDGALYTGMINEGHLFDISHLTLYFFYSAVCMLILAPSFLHLTGKKSLLITGALVLITGVAGHVMDLVDFLPARSLMNRLFASVPFFTGLVQVLVTGIVITGAAGIVISLCIKAREHIKEPFYLFNVLAILAIGITCGFITLQFNSRYTFQAAPFIILLAAHEKDDRYFWLRMAAGVITGLLSLYSYYFLT